MKYVESKNKLNKLYNIHLPEFAAPNRLILILLGGTLFSLCYLGLGGHPILPIHKAPTTKLDAVIPFIDWMIIPYLSQYFFLMIGLFVSPRQIATKIYYRYLTATLIATIIFIVYPTYLPRISLSAYTTSNYFNMLYTWLYWSDVPYNCFPSLHTALALITAQGLKKIPQWRNIGICWAYFIILSTLTTKQHTCLDVLGGISLFLMTLVCSRIWFNKKYNDIIKL